MLDTSAFIAGLDPHYSSIKVYTVPMVEKELSVNRLSFLRFRIAVDSGKVMLQVPNRKFVELIIKISEETGDILSLSDVDSQILALAFELKNLKFKPIIITDDYSIQNLADKIDIKFLSIANLGIRYRLKWTLICPACFKKCPQDYARARESRLCENCGTPLKRKPVQKNLINS